MSEDRWFTTMFGLDVGAPPLPEPETRLGFIRCYADDSGKRLALLEESDSAWWAREVAVFAVPGSGPAPSPPRTRPPSPPNRDTLSGSSSACP